MVDNEETYEGIGTTPVDSDTLDEIIRSAVFPEDYDAFEDSMLDMIP